MIYEQFLHIFLDTCNTHEKKNWRLHPLYERKHT